MPKNDASSGSLLSAAFQELMGCQPDPPSMLIGSSGFEMTLVAEVGTNLRELMERMGHPTCRAALDLPALHQRASAHASRCGSRPGPGAGQRPAALLLLVLVSVGVRSANCHSAPFCAFPGGRGIRTCASRLLLSLPAKAARRSVRAAPFRCCDRACSDSYFSIMTSRSGPSCRA